MVMRSLVLVWILHGTVCRQIHFRKKSSAQLASHISSIIPAKKGSQGTGTGNITQSPDNLQNLVLQVQITVIRMRFLFFQAFQPSIISGRGDMKYPAYTGNVIQPVLRLLLV